MSQNLFCLVFSNRKCGGEWTYISLLSLLSVFGLKKSVDQIYRRVQTMETTETLSPISSVPSMATTKYLGNKLIVNLIMINENIKCMWSGNTAMEQTEFTCHDCRVCSYTSGVSSTATSTTHWEKTARSITFGMLVIPLNGIKRLKYPNVTAISSCSSCIHHDPPWTLTMIISPLVCVCMCVCVRFSLSFRCHNDGAQTCGARKGLGKLLMSERF